MINSDGALALDKPLEEVDQQNHLFDYFSKFDGASLKTLTSKYTAPSEYLVQARSHKLPPGYGRGPGVRIASVKAVAEVLERRFMKELFASESCPTPKWRQTSNGFAVHFDETSAGKAACNEALERHILQMTYFSKGWKGFRLVGDTKLPGIEIRKIVSRYTCAGKAAGVAVVTSDAFPGAAFGYLCDSASDILSSRRWTHAIGEATGKIEPYIKIREDGLYNSLTPIQQEVHHWLFDEPFEIEFQKLESINAKLPNVMPAVETFDLAKLWDLDFPFFGAVCRSPNILPLIVPSRITAEDRPEIESLFTQFSLTGSLPERSPIL